MNTYVESKHRWSTNQRPFYYEQRLGRGSGNNVRWNLSRTKAAENNKSRGDDDNAITAINEVQQVLNLYRFN